MVGKTSPIVWPYIVDGLWCKERGWAGDGKPVRVLACVESNNHSYISWSSQLNTIIVRDQISCYAERTENVISEWVIYSSQRCYMFHYMYTVSVLCLILIRYCKIQLCVEMHECVLLQLQPNIYIIICCDIANIMCCANKYNYVITYMWTCGD